jgi:two-component system, OmpR family, sensor kinase
MFTSLRSRLWLSYAIVIAIALGITLAIVFVFLLRNPLASREIQEQLHEVQNIIVTDPQHYIDTPAALDQLKQTYHVRVMLFDSNRSLAFDSNSGEAGLPFPRRNGLGRAVQTARDASGNLWLYSTQRLSADRILVVAAPRPRVAVLSIFTDQFLIPVIEAGLIAFLLALILAYAISRWVADPLQDVVHAAQTYPDRETKSLSPRGPHEVQDLTRAFNSMVSRVEGTQKSQREFVANVSHELKTPLTSIQGFAQAILDGTADTPETREQSAQIILNEAGRMHRMVLDLLDLARLDAGTADLKMSAVDVQALLGNIVVKFAPVAQTAGVQLELNLPAGLPALIGDGDRLAQVFTNLIDNALKFTPAGGKVTLAAALAATEMELSVSDTGPGISQDALPRLFDRFYQVDVSRAGGKAHGAGLGLAIVKEIVEAHGGRISVRSELGHGTTFVIHLPHATTDHLSH